MFVKNKRLLAGILALVLATGVFWQSAYAHDYNSILSRVINCVVLTIGLRSLVNSIRSDYYNGSHSTVYKGMMISGTALTVIVVACLMKKDIAEVLHYLSIKLR